MYSLTVVLNDAFAGGGTFFADLRRAISPPVGHVIAFDGHALHGGEPVVRGTRYIVAAFLYIDAAEGGGEEPSRAPPVLETIFAEAAAGRKRARGDDARTESEAGGGAGAGCGFTFNFG